MPETKTPRTDEFVRVLIAAGADMTYPAERLRHHARDIETELAAAQASIAEVTRERDEARSLMELNADSAQRQCNRANAAEARLAESTWANQLSCAAIHRWKDRAESAEALVASLSEALRKLVKTERLLRENDETVGDDDSVTPDLAEDLVEPALANLLIRHGGAWKAAFDLVASLPEEKSHE